MTLETNHNQMIKMTSSGSPSVDYFEDYETALIVAGRRFASLLYWRDDFATRTETSVQFGTNYSWVRFEVVTRIPCQCGKAFKTRRGYNTHRGARGNCKAGYPPAPPRWKDSQGDIWTLGDDGYLHTPETMPFPREHVEKKWGPLKPV